MKSFALKLLHVYQRFFTLLGYGSCRYYPTCSEYAKWQFERNNIFLALWHSTLRILRCNQLFTGGTDYPIIKCPKPTEFKKITVQFWFVPRKSHNDCYMIKTF